MLQQIKYSQKFDTIEVKDESLKRWKTQVFFYFKIDENFKGDQNPFFL